MAELPNILRDIADLEKRVRKLETVRQPLGGDIINVGAGDLGSSGAITLSAGAEVQFTVTVTPTIAKLTLWNMLQTLHIDTDAATHRYNDGASLSSGQEKLWWHWHWDWESSNDAAGIRKVLVTIKNEDTASHTYYYYVAFYNMNIPFS